RSIHGVVAVITERVAHRVRDHDRRREMDDGGDAVASNGLRHQLAVAGRASDERDLARDQEAKTGRQVIEHDDRLPGVDQLMHHVAADIAGPARDQDRHDPIPIFATSYYRATLKERLGQAASSDGYSGHA